MNILYLMLSLLYNIVAIDWIATLYKYGNEVRPNENFFINFSKFFGISILINGILLTMLGNSVQIWILVHGFLTGATL